MNANANREDDEGKNNDDDENDVIVERENDNVAVSSSEEEEKKNEEEKDDSRHEEKKDEEQMEVSNVNRIRYDRDGIGNEYTETASIMGGSFPDLFPCGYPHEGILQNDEVKHMINQASNRFTSNPIYLMYINNMLTRRKVSQAVSSLFKDDKSTLDQLKNALDDPTFRNVVEDGIAYPNSEEAKQLERWISTLMSKAIRHIPFVGGRSSAAFAEMLNYQRFFGNGTLFLTMAPQSWKYGLFYRLAKPMKSNLGNLRGENLSSLIPDKNAKRQSMKYDGPYADVFTYMRHTQAVFEKIINLKVPPNMGNSMLKPDRPCGNRNRGCLGDVSALYNANETSVQGNLHSHTIIYTNVDWKLIETIVEYPSLNKKLGEYLDSIIASEMTHLRTHDLNPKPEFPDPTTVHLSKDSVPYPTVTVLPYLHREMN